MVPYRANKTALTCQYMDSTPLSVSCGTWNRDIRIWSFGSCGVRGWAPVTFLVSPHPIYAQLCWGLGSFVASLTPWALCYVHSYGVVGTLFVILLGGGGSWHWELCRHEWLQLVCSKHLDGGACQSNSHIKVGTQCFPAERCIVSRQSFQVTSFASGF